MLNKLISHYGSIDDLLSRYKELKDVIETDLQFVLLPQELVDQLDPISESLEISIADCILLILDHFIFSALADSKEDPCHD